MTAQCWFFPRISEVGQLRILIVTIAKIVILKAKYKESAPKVQHFHALLKIEAQKEEKHAIHTNTRDAFLRKWRDCSKILTTCD